MLALVVRSSLTVSLSLAALRADRSQSQVTCVLFSAQSALSLRCRRSCQTAPPMRPVPFVRTAQAKTKLSFMPESDDNSLERSSLMTLISLAEVADTLMPALIKKTPLSALEDMMKRIEMLSDEGVSLPVVSQVIVTQKFAEQALATLAWEKWSDIVCFWKDDNRDVETPSWDYVNPLFRDVLPKSTRDMSGFTESFYGAFFNNASVGMAFDITARKDPDRVRVRVPLRCSVPSRFRVHIRSPPEVGYRGSCVMLLFENKKHIYA